MLSNQFKLELKKISFFNSNVSFQFTVTIQMWIFFTKFKCLTSNVHKKKVKERKLPLAENPRTTAFRCLQSNGATAPVWKEIPEFSVLMLGVSQFASVEGFFDRELSSLGLCQTSDCLQTLLCLTCCKAEFAKQSFSRRYKCLSTAEETMKVSKWPFHDN